MEARGCRWRQASHRESHARRYNRRMDYQDDDRRFTYHQVLAADRRAYRRGETDEFIYLPGGIMYWHSLVPGARRTYCCSLPVRDRTMPDDGWVHERPCDCHLCARA